MPHTSAAAYSALAPVLDSATLRAVNVPADVMCERFLELPPDEQDLITQTILSLWQAHRSHVSTAVVKLAQLRASDRVEVEGLMDCLLALRRREVPPASAEDSRASAAHPERRGATSPRIALVAERPVASGHTPG